MMVPIPFDLLPTSARRAVTRYMTVDGDRPGFAEELRFIVGEMSAADMIARCWNAPDNEMRDDHPDWEAYHAWYCEGEDAVDYVDHLAEMWPVILCDREGVADGWHRLHWYLRNGVAAIPTVDLVEAA
jgi:hypothetical protein